MSQRTLSVLQVITIVCALMSGGVVLLMIVLPANTVWDREQLFVILAAISHIGLPLVGSALLKYHYMKTGVAVCIISLLLSIVAIFFAYLLMVVSTAWR